MKQGIFAGKTAVITGGAHGIGRAISDAFLREGAAVHIIDIQPGDWFVGDVSRKEDKVIGRIDASLISSRSDASCFSAYMDWICVLKSERHHKVAQALLKTLREKCKEQGVGVLIALMANNNEAQSFYKSVENASMHDTGIWIDIA